MYDKPNDSIDTTYNHDSKQFVLVVDDDPQTSWDHAEDLRDWGYEPVVAEGQGTKLIEDAKAKARQHCCRVAVVDMRLSEAEGDESGLTLAGELAPTACIIVTAYGSIPATNRSRRYNNIVSFFEKGDDPGKLKGEVHDAFGRFRACNLRVEGPGNDELRNSTSGGSYEEIRCALGFLYRDEILRDYQRIERLYLTPLDDPHRSQITTAIPTQPVVYMAEPVLADCTDFKSLLLQREIVKIARKERVAKEVRNYSRFIKGFLRADRCARIEDRRHAVMLWNVGAIRYTNIARDDRHLFRTWYASASIEELKRALTDLFRETLGPLYRARTLDGSEDKAGNQSVYNYYVAHALPPNFEGHIKDYSSRNSDAFDAAPMLGRSLMLRDPVKWACEYRSQSVSCSRCDALTHGDLHSGNIFVDADCKTYVMGFEQSGPGYALRDFVRLEVEILLGLTKIAKHELERFFQLAIALYRPRDPDEGLLPTDLVINHFETRKAFLVISHLRRILYELLQPQDRREYLWAVLLESLGWLLQSHSSLQAHHGSTTHDRALILASVVCERLADWDRTDWPLGEWGKLEWLGISKLRARERRVQVLLGQLQILRAQLRSLSHTEQDQDADDAEVRRSIERIRQELSTYGELPEERRETEIAHPHPVKAGGFLSAISDG